MENYVYFFSNFFLINVGILFLLPLFFRTKEEYDVIRKYIFGNSAHIYLGIMGLVLTVLCLIFPMTGPIIIGDLLPAAGLLLYSLMLLLGYIRVSKYLKRNMVREGEMILNSFQIPAGILGIIIGVLHIFLGRIFLL